MLLRDDDLVELNANFSVEPVEDRLALVLDSAGGDLGRGRVRNEDYVPALRLLLERLRQLDAHLLDGTVDSRTTQKLPIHARRLALRNRTYPVAMANEPDIEDLRLAITSAQGTVGVAPTAKPGNNRKRIRLVLAVPGFDSTAAPALAQRLALPAAPAIDLFPAPDTPIISAGAMFHVRPVEAVHTTATGFDRSARTIFVRRAEGSLVHSYLRWLGVASATRSFSNAGVSDIFVDGPDGAEIIEAKSTTRHSHVRLALGQLLDYAYAAPPHVSVARLTALFPDLPSRADLGLLHAYGIDCIRPAESGFVRLAAPDSRRDHMRVVWDSASRPAVD